MLTQADRGILVLALLARRDQITQQHRLCCEVVQVLRQVGASADDIKPHDRYIELHLQELSDVSDVLKKVHAL